MKTKLAFAFALLLAFPLAFLTILAFSTPITPSGTLYLLGLALLTAGGLLAPWRLAHARAFLAAGLIVVTLTAGVRLILARQGANTTIVTLPGGRARWLNRLIDEQDVTLFATRVLPLAGMILPDEHKDAISTFRTIYQTMRQTEGLTPSPFASTYLGLQRPTVFDATIIESGGGQSPTSGVVFLHGFAGNFTMQCWLVAQAAREAGAVTVCPSVGANGDWWQPHGEAALRVVLDTLQGWSVERVYLAGLSNGGVGASELAPRFAPELAGLILISGASPLAPDSGLPTLVVHSTEDGRIPVSVARDFVHRVHDATYVEFPGDHFVFAKNAEGVREAIVEWMKEQ